MYYIGNVVKSVTGFYNQINSATLTGAIDIVVVQQEDGTFVGSPFHVRFGKLGVVSSREKLVEIAINDEEVDLQMKLGVAGEAFFVEKVFPEENVPYNLATSPIPSSMFLLGGDRQFTFKDSEEDISQDVDNVPQLDYDQGVVVHGEDSQLLSRTQSSPIPINPSKIEHLAIPQSKLTNKIIHKVQMDYPLSDLDSPISGSPTEDALIRHVFSDTELETTTVSHPSRNNKEQNITWEWGMLPEGTPLKKKKPSRSESSSSGAHKKSNKLSTETSASDNKKSPVKNPPPPQGLLLDEVLEMEDKEVADLYLNRANSLDDLDSGYGQVSTPTATSNVDSPPAFEYNSSPVKQELAEDFNKDDTLPNLDEEEPKEVVMSLCGGLMTRRVAPDKFDEFFVSYEAFCENPGILNNPKLVIKINESYYNWSVAGPYLMSFLVFERTLQQDCLRTLKQRYMPRKRRGWFYWRTPQDQESSEDEMITEKEGVEHVALEKLTERDNEDIDSDTVIQMTGGGAGGGVGGGSDNLVSDDDVHEYKKTLRLTSDEWKKLNLQYGTNKITFTVTTRYQGTASCHARIFLWSYADKVVISDIDGTITKSDVLGQILPAMGRDWSQTGVTGLFSKIKRNGYNFIYLSARAISQAQLTRDFLHSVKQGELTLPDGPVLLTPTSLFHAFKKEVIERKPEEFKISCMKDIQKLYEQTSNPFYAGFGNRVNDVYAYRAVGIPISRIFTINYKGEIKHEKSQAFSSSYSELIELVDQMFPPLSSSKNIDPAQSEYTAFSFWRTPMTEMPELTELNHENFEFP